MEERSHDDRTLDRIVGKRARSARQAQGLTVEQVAERVGRDVEWYTRMEHGHVSATSATLMRMARVLGTSTDYFLLDQGHDHRESAELPWPEPPWGQPTQVVAPLSRRSRSIPSLIAVFNEVQGQ